MSQPIIDPETVWVALRSEKFNAGEVPSKVAGLPVLGRDIRYAITSSGRARLLIPVAPESTVPSMDESESLSLSVAMLGDGSVQSRYLDLVCHEGGLDPVFSEVVRQIIARIAAGSDGASACASTLSDFRSLLSTAGRARVSRAARVGLIGELIVLQRLLAINPKAIEVWRGPLDQRHDFRTERKALEVKCTARPGYKRVSVHSLDQLMEPANGELWLAHVVLEEVSGSGTTVGSLVADIEREYDCMLQLRERLAKLECRNPLDDDWNMEAFSLESVDLYKVRGGFPRLVPAALIGAQLPSGVDEVTYSADLGAAAAFRIPAYEIAATLKHFLGN